MNEIELDTDAFVLYRFGDLRFFAVANDEAFRIRQLLQRFRDLQEIPKTEMVEGFFLQPDDTTGKLGINNGQLVEVKINELNFTWGRIMD